MLFVFGASGQTCGEVTRQLAAQGVPTRALVHNPEKARMLSGLNVEIALEQRYDQGQRDPFTNYGQGPN